MNKKKLHGLALAGLVTATAAYLWYNAQPVEPPQQAAAPADKAEPPQASAPITATTSVPKPTATDDALQEVRQTLQDRYGDRLNQPTAQIKLLEEMMRYLSGIDPEHWQENLLALLELWFPDHSSALTDKLTALLAYRDFMEQERYTLRTMGPEERRDFLWAKRQELFGDDAELIWQAEIRNHALAQSLKQINAANGSPVDKARSYTDAIQQTYGDQASSVLEQRRQELTDRFLIQPSIQATLSQQSESERYRTLRTIRSELGMDEEALERWTELDQTRDQRWSKGEQYQAQRNAIVQSYEAGPERDAALDQAAKDIFGDGMAEVIRSEEATGYYRFDQERVYGQN
ncbi:hypothetical protein LPB19_10030 [Marinobacter salinisoli]|uniref:Lipase helper protein n=1 Tax=Marinobacter salinisoli TaxID=2769486 RepID=A0ABX7MMW2_9GAMM|nr:hypothetical protein [Marinobacter salinisoli]QSP93556.1 hypothetical protein LPB19_10030 [Marinobacter salinisoli]